MIYCKKCIIPSTRPNNIIGDDGICNACKAQGYIEQVNWPEREQMFRELVKEVKAMKREYDCLIPVSGGKDSTWQVAKCVELGLRPLAVTWKTPARTELGAHNLKCLISIGVDHIDFQINPKVEKKFLLKALDRYGAVAIPMHMAIFNIPLKIASLYKIPLVVWGENSALQYGGGEDEWKGLTLDSEWLAKYGVTHGTTAKDWVDEDLTAEEMTPYFGPSDKDVEEAGIRAVFLGCYFKWDPEMTMREAKKYGFKVREEGPKTGCYNYADIDDEFISIHHYLKWYKFGMTRSFDNLSLEIRSGRTTREEAIQTLKKMGDETPVEDIRKFCDFTGISVEEFYRRIEKFRNKTIWKYEKGMWTIPDYLIPEWDWNKDGAKEYANAI